MAILGREFIAAPDNSKGQIVYKWPDQNIRKFTRCIVEPDAVAVFMSQGQLMGTLLGGHHQLDAKELPFLGMFVDWATGGNAFKAELYFVGIRDFPRFRFGGRLDEVQDPQTGLIVTLRTFGEYALRVVDAPKLILNLVGTVDVTNNEAITGWVAQQILKVTRTTVTTQLASGTWPILGLSVHSPEIEVAVKQAANSELADYGISITRLGNLDVNLDDDDNARLKKLAGDTAYSRLAGGFLQAAQAEALGIDVFLGGSNDFGVEADGMTPCQLGTSGCYNGVISIGGDLYFRTLVEYLTHFTGRFAAPVTAFGPPGTSWSRDRPLLCRALGLAEQPEPGDPVRFTDEIAFPDGVVYFVNAHAIGVRTPDALYRFMRGFAKPVVAAHHLFGPGAEPDQARQAWEAWLSRTLA